ncbi:MAG: AAA family ATPase [Micrococcales bacterium]|nr:AAA family ATPase [Micrococcales bacterium]
MTSRPSPGTSQAEGDDQRYEHALVLGKFWPLHAGHQHLVDEAVRVADQVTVQLLVHPAEDVPMAVRRSWLAELYPPDRFPGVRLVAATDDIPTDFADPGVWDQHMAIIESLLDAPVDVVLTSDDYGAELARRLGAAWHQVDPGRVEIPVSGTAVRADPQAHWHHLAPPVRAWYARRVVVTGAESTGTTTLAAALAQALGAVWVPEYGRQWSADRPGGLAAPWTTDEFVTIATRQTALEDAAARAASTRWVVCDTDAVATALWHERYLGTRARPVDALADASLSGRATFGGGRPDLVVLTGDEIGFVQDGLRDGEHVRHAMQHRFRAELARRDLPWLEVHGPVADRLAQVLAALPG